LWNSPSSDMEKEESKRKAPNIGLTDSKGM
jgi:hypothetical protein